MNLREFFVEWLRCLSGQEQRMEILRQLEDSPRPLFGLEMVKASNGLLRTGSIYWHLARLGDDGLVWQLKDVNSGRAIYHLTAHGKEYLARQQAGGPK